ncbi:hypothetical protein [Nostoc sp.]|uniref:hypothetical protein n=1 Tax=Nostoc sp. TaxID=1180 RepID=UPI002FF7358C
MGRIKIRLSGHPKDVEAFGSFLTKTSTYITALKIISIGANRPMRESTDVFSYGEVEFDSSAMEDK